MKPYISVVIPTNRAGGMDILFESLKAQSFQNFELVIADALYPYRKDIVAEKAKEYNFPVKHLDPKDNTFPISNYCKSINTAICASEGEIVYFTSDHNWMPQDVLLTHADFHKNTPRNHALFLHVSEGVMNIEAVSHNFPKDRQYGSRGKWYHSYLMQVPEAEWVGDHNEWSDRYMEDIKNGLLDKVMWSIFEEPFVYERGLDYLIVKKDNDTKFQNCPVDTPMPVFHDLCCLKNDSFKWDFLIEANGMDEEMDGTHGYQDTELARRLLRVHGCQFFAMNKMSTRIINTRYFLEPRKIINGYNNDKIIVRKNLRETALSNNTITEWKKKKE